MSDVDVDVVGVHVYQIDFTLIIAATAQYLVRARYIFAEMRLSNDGTNADYFRMVHRMRKWTRKQEMLSSTLWMGFELLEIQAAEIGMESIQIHVK